MSEHVIATPVSQPHRDAPEPARIREDEIALSSVARIVSKHRYVLASLPAAAAIVALIAALLMPDVYTARAKIVPPQQAQSASSSLLTPLAGLAGQVSVRNPLDLYVGMLRSRKIADSLVSRFDLMKLHGVEYASQARQRLASATRFARGRDGIVTIEVDDRDPRRAAALANAYVEELLKLTQGLALTNSSRRRVFFERQFALARDNLARSEAAARDQLSRAGIVALDEQSSTTVASIGRLRGEITVKDVQIAGMHAFAGEANPELRQAEHERDAMRRQLAKLESGAGGAAAASAELVGGMESLRTVRDLKYYQVIYASLAQQFEVAKLDEARESAVVQVLDRATEPDRSSGPNVTGIVVVSTVLAAFAAMFIVFVAEMLERARASPRQWVRVQALRRYLGGRRAGRSD